MNVAAFTMAYNEAVFLPLWCRYYGDILGEDNLFIIDHGSTDGSTNNAGLSQLIRIPRNKLFDEEERAQFISRFHASLLYSYDIVIFSDTDEFLIPDPARYIDLLDYCNQLLTDTVSAVGLEVLHVPDQENALDWSKPVLAQRHYLQFSAMYCKTLISKIPLSWSPGFHLCDRPPIIDPRLFLFHLRRIDRDYALARLKERFNITWSVNAITHGHSLEHRMSANEYESQFFAFTSETIAPFVSKQFDFSKDLVRFSAHTRDAYKVPGTISTIPERFASLIKGTMQEEKADIASFQNQHNDVLKKIWDMVDPYSNFQHRRYRPDRQGWNSDHPYLSSSLEELAPSIIVEIGVWKGASVLRMAETAKQLGLKTTIIAVDTWLGSVEHWISPEWRQVLLRKNGYLYYTFLTNMVEYGCADMVVPIPLDSANAVEVLKHYGIRPDLIHLDASHDYPSVICDLKRWWALLEPGGVFVAGGYDETGHLFPGVRDAIREFLGVTSHEGFEALPYKCRFRKMSGS